MKEKKDKIEENDCNKELLNPGTLFSNNYKKLVLQNLSK